MAAPEIPPAVDRPARKSRLLILIVAYNAERTIRDVLSRVPHRLASDYDVEVLILDDASQDGTFERTRAVQSEGVLPFPLRVLFNPVNQGYGGNQKIGYHLAIEERFDFVALVHGDGQYAPECLPDLVRPLQDGEADAVFGSRMLERGAALRGGMPLYKFVGNRVLSWFQNRLLGASLSEFHSGYRVYSVAALGRIPFSLNTNDFHFDTEIIIQFMLAGLRIKELPIPTYYGDEISRVNGFKYAWDVTKAVLVGRAQRMGLFYDRRFDCDPRAGDNAHYELKVDSPSPHAEALERVVAGSRVLDLGCAGGYVGAALRQRRGCRVTGVDRFPLGPGVELDAFLLHDLNDGPPAVVFSEFDYVLLLDVIEHLSSPEGFLDRLREALTLVPGTTMLVSTANIGFVVNRLMLLIGQFNYGKRGILDLTHTRLFTFESFRRLFEQAGFRVTEAVGIPAPFSLVLGNTRLARVVTRMNAAMVWLARGLFSYQIFFVVQPLPSLEFLLREARTHSALRSEPEHIKSVSCRRITVVRSGLQRPLPAADECVVSDMEARAWVTGRILGHILRYDEGRLLTERLATAGRPMLAWVLRLITRRRCYLADMEGHERDITIPLLVRWSWQLMWEALRKGRLLRQVDGVVETLVATPRNPCNRAWIERPARCTCGPTSASVCARAARSAISRECSTSCSRQWDLRFS